MCAMTGEWGDKQHRGCGSVSVWVTNGDDILSLQGEYTGPSEGYMDPSGGSVIGPLYY